ncbi:hypothetical protein SEA_REYNAULD_36 [Rhodococcus phage Reynauld]|uniref:Uncharacterized protein n=1 Tax=Rhodococcus phage Reynauld TaxID=3062845 RepID=A0ACD4UH75_9CAUD|nr:hypothetical protein SEA_REYNAULD_36 [Rhodococcus phage Reynauld]
MELMGYPLVQATPSALLAGMVILIAMGRLIPKAQHDREMKFRDDLIVEERGDKVQWRDAALEAQRTVEAALEAARYITENETAATRLVETMQQKYTPQHGDGGQM